MFVRLILFGSLFPLLRQGYHPSQIPPVFTYAFDLEPERFLIQVDVRRVGSTSFYKLSSLRNSETRIIVEFAKNVESLHPPRLCFLKPNLSTRRMQDVTDSALSHNQYLQFVSEQLKTSQGPKAHQQVPEKLALLELTPIRLLVLDTDAGRPAFAPEAMLRTFMAMLFCGITSPTQ